MSRIVITIGGSSDDKQVNPYRKYLFCTCGRLVDDKFSVVMISNGNMVNMCGLCKKILEKYNANQFKDLL